MCLSFLGTERELNDTQQSKYEEDVGTLQTELEKPNPSISKVKRLMVATFEGRRIWIRSDTPSVEEVLDVFPPLKESNRVSVAFVSCN